MTMIDFIRQQIDAQKPRSAWNRGVKKYEYDILETLEEAITYSGHEPETTSEFIDYMLNGAYDHRAPSLFNNWKVASYGGSYLICDGDIAARLCTPSELRKTAHGEKNPNPRENWLDVQARALYQAGQNLRSYAYSYLVGREMSKY